MPSGPTSRPILSSQDNGAGLPPFSPAVEPPRTHICRHRPACRLHLCILEQHRGSGGQPSENYCTRSTSIFMPVARSLFASGSAITGAGVSTPASSESSPRSNAKHSPTSPRITAVAL